MNQVKFDPEILDPVMRKLLGCDDGNHEWTGNEHGDRICKFCGERMCYSSYASGMGTWGTLSSNVTYKITTASSQGI